MRKTLSILRHLRCIARKIYRGQRISWHWHHIQREFGTGPYCDWDRRG